ncbi:MAG: superoxide dismutase [Ni] [Desulfotignum sp.]
MKKIIATVFLLLAAMVPIPMLQQTVYAHCQIPCGIYDDNARVQSMLEDAETVEKSIKMINALSEKSDAHSRNQLVRWVMNKENHAQKIISTISDYFLTQRVKSSQEDYTKRLVDHHAVIVSAMKAKQNAEMSYVKTLVTDIKALLRYYNSDHDQ